MFLCSKGQNGVGGQELQCSCVLRGRMGGGWAGITMFLCSKGQNGGGRNCNVPVF